MASVEGPSPITDGEGSMSAGEFVLKKLFAEFVALSDRKLQDIASQPFDYPLGKALQKGEDPHFDQLLTAINEVASFCLRSILTSIFKWRDMQIQQCRSNTSWSTLPSGDATDSPCPANRREKEYFTERQELAIEFVFCLVLIEVLTKLTVHPVPESFIHTIEDYAFKHFKVQETLKESRTNFANPNIQNMKKIADLYAEVIGVLSQSRFHSVRRKFFVEIRNPQNSSNTIISIIEGMSFIRVKMFPVDDLEQWFAFLQECATFFLECREKIKHAMSALLVEILLPVAAVIKFEASLPVVKKFVSMLFNHCYEHTKKGRHSTAYIPLVTVLLAISEQHFFLNHWHGFLVQMVIPSIKRGDNKLQRIALEALNRLVWVYMVRIKGESNITTQSRLRYIADALFPRSTKEVRPRDMPLNIFVKLIQFIARERLEYAMLEILELLNTGRTRSVVNPERMVIGLRAFLVITDSLEKKEGEPPMPLNACPPPSGGPTRVKTKYLSTTITDATAKKIGITKVYPQVQRALDGILLALDHSVGKSFLSTSLAVAGKSQDELLSGAKPKLDLLKTCVAAIPRIMPEGMLRDDLIDLMSRFTIHIDHELVRIAFTSLKNLINNFPAWRHDITRIFARFILRDIPDSCPLVLDSALKMLIQMITHWKSLITTETQAENTSAPPVTQSTSSTAGTSSGGGDGDEVYYCVPWVEACALVTLCSYRSVTRRLSLVLLKETRGLHEMLKVQTEHTTVMDVIEKATPSIIKRYLATLTQKERTELRLSHQGLTLAWMADRSSCFLEQGGSRDSLRDAWAQCLAGLLEPHLLPEVCPNSVHIAWPYTFQRMGKAYAVLDPSGVASEKADRPPSIKGRRPVISSPEMFLWRNYLMFVSCTAPPSTSLQGSLMSSGDRGLLEGIGGRVQSTLNARNLFHKVVPLIRSEGEIREVAITALGLIHPNAFGDLVEELNSIIHDALDQRRSDKTVKKKRRETLRVQITRVFALTAEHGCFRQSHMTRTDKGEVSPVFLEFIEAIKNCLETESDRVVGYLTELRLYFAALIANMINSLPKGEARLRLFSPEMRYNLFYLFANWCGLFGPVVQDPEQEARRNPRASALSFNSLQAMSALICCGTVFRTKELERESNIYRWLENMLSSGEPKVQTLGRKTLQLLLENNPHPTLLQWVIDRCYDSKASCAQLCFHALSNTLAAMPTYPCEMVTVLHVVLFKTADLEYSTRERATHLLQILDRRFFVSSDDDNETGNRTELLGCLTTGAYSQCHITLSRELALANPELTLPMFCEMVHRYEMATSFGKRSILEYMVPWLRNVELVEDAHLSHPHVINQSDYPIDELDVGESYQNPVLKGNGWGSIEGTKVVLHNLLYITAKYGDDHIKEVEALWSALCVWPQNIRATLNYLGRLTCVSGNLPLMLQQAKRIMLCLSRNQTRPIVTELIKDLQSVELLSADIQVTDSPPYYHITTAHGTMRHTPHHRHTHPQPEGLEGTGWAVAWRVAVRIHGHYPVPLPLPFTRQHFVNMREILKAPSPKPIGLHRCNFALILLSELVVELYEVDWSPHLPLLLHVVILGLNLYRPLVYDHSKKLLGNLFVVLACRNNKMAALQARFAQQEVSLSSFSASSLNSEGDHTHPDGSRTNLYLGSIDSLHDTNTILQSALSVEARELIHFVAARDTHRPPWPFADLSNRLSPSGQVAELTGLVGKILQVFQNIAAQPLKEKWAMIALQWATGCSSHQYASQSFQVCRALQLPLSSSMFREVLTRLAESASEDKDDMQSYVLEIVLTLESAVDYIEEDPLQPSNVLSPRRLSAIGPLPGDMPDTPHSYSPPPSADSGACAPIGVVSVVSGIKHRHSRGRSITNTAEMMRPSSAKAKLDYTSGMDVGGASSRSMSPIGPSVREPQRTPIVPPQINLREHAVGVSLPTRPHSTIVQSSRTAPIAIPDVSGKTLSSNAHYIPVESPQKSSPLESVLQENNTTSHDGGAAPASSASAPDTKQIDLTKDTISTLVVGVTGSEEKEVRPRKISEPPPSLQALFDRDMGSSRRWMNKQLSADHVHIAHPKQHSLDGTHLRSVTPQSPKYDRRRVKSPSTGDKNNRLDATVVVTSTNIQRTPSHPHLNSTNSNPHVPPSPSDKSPMHEEPIVRSRSTQQLPQDIENEESGPIRSNSVGKADSPNHTQRDVTGALKHEKEDPEISMSKESLKDGSMFSLKKSSLTVSRESVLSRDSGTVTLKELPGPQLPKDICTSTTTVDGNKDNRERSGPSKSLQDSAEGSTESLQAPVSHQQISPQKVHADLRRRNSSQQYGLLKKEMDSLGNLGASGRKRPRSMIETSSYRYGPSFTSDTINPPTPDLLAQLFWTATSMLESDYEGEYLMAQRLLSKVLDHLVLDMNDTYERLEALLDKMRWSSFPGVQTFLLKGLTLDSTSEPSRTLLSRITLHSTRSVFDPSQYAGLPLNVMSLMPVLIHHFDQPTEFCIKVVSNIQQACTSVDLPSEESKMKLVHMSKMFQMYATQDFSNGVDLWLAGICRYLNDAYPPLSVKILSLLAEMLDKGRDLYHRPVIRLLYEYTRLQDPNSIEMKKMADTIMTVATQHVKGALWKEALDLLKLAVSNSASLVQPPTRGLPVDLGLFNQTLPGPTLQFTMDLHHGSGDLGLANGPHAPSSWKRPQASQRRSRERLLSVLNACGPVPVLMSSPSVVFTDEQALIGDKGTLYSSTSEEAASSITDEILESSQPESQVYITAVGNEFDFLNEFEYKYEQSSSEGETPGPFTRSFQVLDAELEEREEDSSLPGSLMGSRHSLVESAAGEDTEGQVESDDRDLDESASPPRASSPRTLNLDLSPDKSPDVSHYRLTSRRHTSPEKSPLIFRKSHDHFKRKSHTYASGLGQLDERSPDQLSQEMSADETVRQGYHDKSPKGKHTKDRSHDNGRLARDMSPDTRRSRDGSPRVREGSHDNSTDSKETSPNTKHIRERSHDRKQTNRLSQHRGSTDSQTEQKPLQLFMPDASPPNFEPDRGSGVGSLDAPSANSSSSEAPSLLDTSPQQPSIEHLKSLSVDSRPSSDRHSQQSSGEILSDGETAFPSEQPPREVDPGKQYLNESSIISPTLKVAPVNQFEEDASQDDQKTDRLKDLSEDSLGEVVLEMLAKGSGDHDKSNDSNDIDEDNKTVAQTVHDLQPEESKTVLAAGVSEGTGTATETVAQSERDQLEPDDVLAELDHVLELEEEGSASEEESTPSSRGEAMSRDVSIELDDTGVTTKPAGDSETVSNESQDDSTSAAVVGNDVRKTDSTAVESLHATDIESHDQRDRSHDQTELSQAGAEESHDPSEPSTPALELDTRSTNGNIELSSASAQITVSHDTTPQTTPPESTVSRFLDYSGDEIEEVWRDHVTRLCRDKSPSTAVHTYFIVNRLLSMLRIQSCNLTREACNYLGNGYKSIASHFLVTTEFLLSQFELPKVYIDAEMVTQSELLERIVFVVLELKDNHSGYVDKKRNVQESLTLFKQALREASMSQDQAALSLCRAVHKFHFQLLVLLGSYVKLIDMLRPSLEKCGLSEICQELTVVIHESYDAMLTVSRGPSPPFDDDSEREVGQLVGVADAVRILEDTLSQKQYLRAIQLLHVIRKNWKEEDVFGSDEEDDVDCLFFVYARYATDRQEGILCITNTENKLSAVHHTLMSQNVSLHSLLEQCGSTQEQATPPPSELSITREQATPPPQDETTHPPSEQHGSEQEQATHSPSEQRGSTQYLATPPSYETRERTSLTDHESTPPRSHEKTHRTSRSLPGGYFEHSV